jgi:hypothetical protein
MCVCVLFIVNIFVLIDRYLNIFQNNFFYLISINKPNYAWALVDFVTSSVHISSSAGEKQSVILY